MFRLSKKIEYAILAVQYLANRKSELVTAKEMAEELDLSFEFLSKTLQTLIKHELIVSYQGTKGGYQLAKSPENITIAEIIFAIESKPALVECMEHHSENVCRHERKCKLKDPMSIIQNRVLDFFQTTTIEHLTKS